MFVAVLGGGQEEAGWRGFALPRLQRRWRPWRATLLLGLIWGVWHIPLYGPLGWILPLFLAFLYTYLYNVTESVFACVLLHASFTPALENLILVPASAAPAGDAHGAADLAILGTVVLAAATLTVVTKGNLGYRPPDTATVRLPVMSAERRAHGGWRDGWSASARLVTGRGAGDTPQQ